MNDLEDWQEEAVRFGGAMGGEYLESIGKTDLAMLTAEEWETFIRCVVINAKTKWAELEPCPF